MLSNDLKSKINLLWDKFWSGGIANPITAIEQISYLLFIRRMEEMDEQKKLFSDLSATKNHKSIFSGKYTPKSSKESINRQLLRWSKFKEMEPGQMLEHIQRFVFPFIKEELSKDETDPFARNMQNAVFIMPKPSLLAEAIGVIEDIYASIDKEVKENNQTFQDTQGDIYEYLLNEISRAGKNGQFRTPRHIIQMICQVIDPKLGETICDPTCGTGGFLLGAYQHILTDYTSKKYTSENKDSGFSQGTMGDKLTDKKLRKVLLEKTFYGYDFDTTMVRLGLMNLMLHGITHPNLDYTDTLSKKFTDRGIFNVILANPPFKGSIDKGDINSDLELDTTKTELLFVNRIIDLLVIGGRAGVIIPDGVLFGNSNAHQQLRKMLLYRCQLDAVISMPAGVFKPYAGVSTAILIFSKAALQDEVRHTDNVWFYNMESDGYTLDDKRIKLKDFGDLQDVPSKFKERKKYKDNKRTEKCFYVSAVEIEKNNFDLSLNKYKETVYEEAKYDSPKTLLRALIEQEEKIISALHELNKIIR